MNDRVNLYYWINVKKRTTFTITQFLNEVFRKALLRLFVGIL